MVLEKVEVLPLPLDGVMNGVQRWGILLIILMVKFSATQEIDADA
jgi:hypothetical protein